jgi:hypothetical protein
MIHVIIFLPLFSIYISEQNVMGKYRAKEKLDTFLYRASWLKMAGYPGSQLSELFRLASTRPP